MDKTDIEVTEETRQRLREWMEERDLTYDEAINRLLDHHNARVPLTLEMEEEAEQELEEELEWELEPELDLELEPELEPGTGLESE